MSKTCGGDLLVGDPVSIRRLGVPESLGRIRGFGGKPLDGIYPHVFVGTNGSVIEMGRAWVHPIENEPKTLEALKNLETKEPSWTTT